MPTKEIIVSFVHTNYVVKTGGTEKFVGDLSKVLQEQGYDHLCFFSFIKQKSLKGKKIVGINYNDKFVAIIESKQMPQVLSYYLFKEKAIINCFHLQHIKYHEIKDVLDTLNISDAEICIFIHDFYYICCSQHFLRQDGSFCSTDVINDYKCGNCAYYEEAKIHINSINNLFSKVEHRIKNIICPSEFVKKVFSNAYPELKNKLCIRPHLTFYYDDFNVAASNRIEEPIRLAYIGRKFEHKGYKQWKEIIKEIPKGSFELFYLGKDIDSTKTKDEVKEIYVSTAIQGSDAMAKAIAENRIDCAFIWPSCPETYSFVYYELLMAGVFIITNNISGNIKEEIEHNGNGKIFTSLEECKKWMRMSENVLGQINSFKDSGIKLPSGYGFNENTSMCFSNVPSHIERAETGSFKILILDTILYRIKYSKYKI